MLLRMGVFIALCMWSACTVPADTEPCSSRKACAGPKVRPERWAVPLLRPGLPNLYKVSDVLYRSAQPSAGGMRQARMLGIKTVVNLRSYHSDSDEIGATGLVGVRIKMKAWRAKTQSVVSFLKIVTDPGMVPVLVHCKHGSDRTGVMVAAYRMVVQGWSRQEATREMKKGGYGYHRIWGNLPRFLKRLNVARVRREVGIGGKPTGR